MPVADFGRAFYIYHDLMLLFDYTLTGYEPNLMDRKAFISEGVNEQSIHLVFSDAR